jgi:NAD(P)-dependent dehydrogenase (short-subunit alcohol dehydrogenase family)
MQSKRVALVTGANQGVGFQVAKELVRNGRSFDVFGSLCRGRERTESKRNADHGGAAFGTYRDIDVFRCIEH